MKYPDNLIFCDFDGVLTSEEDGTYFNPEVNKYTYSIKCVRLLLKLCNETRSKIVISSNWRKFADDDCWVNGKNKFFNPLPKLRTVLKDYIYDVLPVVRHMNKSKALTLWFDSNVEFNGNFVIFDDDLNEGF